MGDKNLNKLLAWSLENQDGYEGPKNQGQLDPELLKSLFGGPSEADLMKAAMENITSTDPEVTLESKLTAFDNFEQLIERGASAPPCRTTPRVRRSCWPWAGFPRS